MKEQTVYLVVRQDDGDPPRIRSTYTDLAEAFSDGFWCQKNLAGAPAHWVQKVVLSISNRVDK